MNKMITIASRLLSGVLIFTFLSRSNVAFSQDAEDSALERADIDRAEEGVIERLEETGENLGASAGKALKDEYSRDRHLLGRDNATSESNLPNQVDSESADDSDASIERDIDKLQAE